MKNIKSTCFSVKASRGQIEVTDSFTGITNIDYHSTSRHKWTGVGFVMTHLSDTETISPEDAIPEKRIYSSEFNLSPYLSIKQMLNSGVSKDAIKLALSR